MTTGLLGLRTSGSYGSLPQQQSQNGSSPPIQTTPPPRKPSKMLKDKDRLFHCIRKLAPRKKVGMLLLCLVSTAVFGCVLYVGKGEDSQAANIHISLNDSLPFPELPPMDGEEDEDESIFPAVSHEGVIESIAEPPPSPPPPRPADEGISESMAEPPPSPPTPHPEDEDDNILPVLDHEGLSESTVQLSPPPPAAAAPPPTITPVSRPKYFTGYTLPPGNPCEGFTLPPPPADKKRTGPRPCPVCYLPVEQAISLMPKAPSFSPVLKNLTYFYEKSSIKTEFGGSEFGGYPSLQQRSDSYDIKESMSVHCGFVRGVKPGRQTEFDIDDSDLLDMDRCQGVVVSSAIFGAYDLIQQPSNISAHSKKHVCFFMFVDEETEAFLKKSGELDSSRRIGLWRIVVIHNLPFADPRRNGKVPKLLSHRLFPNARYALWIDGKLKLVVDPYQILERFLWRQNASFAISRHYRRFDAFVEAEANKAAGKYDNASIDFQINFYKNEGLTPYSEAKLPITSDVPEGCVIVREHIPISNLFGCLWFNEVDRFTSRDQISFSIVRDKIRSKTNWTINMFLDCERRNFVVQGYHRDVLEHWGPPPPSGSIANPHPPPPIVGARANMTSHGISTKSAVDTPVKKIQAKKRKSSSKRHRKIATGDKDTITG